MYRLIFVLFVFIPYILRGQDLIITQNDSTYQARIIKAEKKIIYYNLFDDPNRELRSMEKRDFKKIKYEKIPKKTNAILIKDDVLSGEDLMINIFQYLLKLGYDIEDFSNEYLLVNTKYLNDHRITVEISENEASFVFYYEFETGITYNRPTTENFIYGKKENPGEYRGDTSNGPFKDMDALCRNYLMTNKATLEYIIE